MKHPSWKLAPHVWLGFLDIRSECSSREKMILRFIGSGMSRQEAEEHLDGFSPIYSMQLRMLISWFAMFLSIPLCLYAAYTDLSAISSSGDLKNWFPRSGASTIAIVIWAEFESITLQLKLRSSPTNVPGYTVTGRYTIWLGRVIGIGLFISILGTLIWGYGDLVIEGVAGLVF